MSIQAEIARLEGLGKLRRYVVPATRNAPKRRLYLAIEAMSDLDKRDSAVNLLVGRPFIEAALARWVSGGRIYGNKRRGLFLDRLDPPPSEIWEIRVTEPVTQARLFGRFAEPDTLILSRFHTRQMLSDRGSAAWKSATQACEACWNDLFPGRTPFSGPNIRSYVTDNCDDFPI